MATTCFLCYRKTPSEVLKEEVYEIDADQDRIDEQMSRSQADSITKQGYLLKGPDSSSDRMFANIGNKSFKRRFVSLKLNSNYSNLYKFLYIIDIVTCARKLMVLIY